MADKDKPKDKPKTKEKKVPTPAVDLPENDAPPTLPDGSYMKPRPFKKGGKVKCMVRGGGIEVRGKTRGKVC